jgi:hypothetical protein
MRLRRGRWRGVRVLIIGRINEREGVEGDNDVGGLGVAPSLTLELDSRYIFCCASYNNLSLSSQSDLILLPASLILVSSILLSC